MNQSSSRRDDSYVHTLVVSQQVQFLKSLYITTEVTTGYKLSVTFFFSDSVDDVDKVDFCLENLESCKEWATKIVDLHLTNNPDHRHLVHSWLTQIHNMNKEQDTLSIYCPGAPGI